MPLRTVLSSKDLVRFLTSIIIKEIESHESALFALCSLSESSEKLLGQQLGEEYIREQYQYAARHHCVCRGLSHIHRAALNGVAVK
jgi:hypothetical protein